MERTLWEEGAEVSCNHTCYRILGKIGQGAFGAVFKALQPAAGQLVAIKTLLHQEHPLPDRTRLRSLTRFQQELHLCSLVDHPYIIKLLDKGYTTSGELCGIFEYVSGISLRRQLLEEGCLPAVEAGMLMGKVLQGLAFLHEKGIVHGDLKPQNIIVVRNSGQLYPVIADLGVSTLLSTDAPVHRPVAVQIAGTPAYGAPEQLRQGAVSIRSDLYSWALILLECLTGFKASHRLQHAGSSGINLPDELAGHPIAALLRNVLHTDPRDRLGDAATVLKQYEQIRLNDLPGRPALPNGAFDDDPTLLVELEL